MYEENLKRYDELVAQCPRFERLGKTMPYTSANGYMFSTLNKDGELGIRFSEQLKKKYMQKFNTTEFKSYNAVMKGYILITDDMFSDKAKLVELLNESYDYVMTLKPK